MVITHRSKNGEGFEEREVQFCDAVEETFQLTMICISPRLANPIFGSLYALTGKAFAFTEVEKLADANCRKLREIIRVYVR